MWWEEERESFKSFKDACSKDVDTYASVSEISSYLYCPRVCYFRQRFNEEPSIVNAAREIYLSLRKGFDVKWALNRFESISGSADVFRRAQNNFVFSEDLQNLTPVDWEIYLISDKLKLKGIVDEIVIDSEVLQSDFSYSAGCSTNPSCESSSGLLNSGFPLLISTYSPQNDVWFRDRIRLAAFCMLIDEFRDHTFSHKRTSHKGYIYYCFDGKLKEVFITRRERLHVIKLIERVLMLRKGFIPDKTKNRRRCIDCFYKDNCKTVRRTFASRFL